MFNSGLQKSDEPSGNDSDSDVDGMVMEESNNADVDGESISDDEDVDGIPIASSVSKQRN